MRNYEIRGNVIGRRTDLFTYRTKGLRQSQSDLPFVFTTFFWDTAIFPIV